MVIVFHLVMSQYFLDVSEINLSLLFHQKQAGWQVLQNNEDVPKTQEMLLHYVLKRNTKYFMSIIRIFISLYINSHLDE